MKTLQEQIIAKQDELINHLTDYFDSKRSSGYTKIKLNFPKWYDIHKQLKSELSALKAQVEQESNNRQQSEDSANNLKTAEEILKGEMSENLWTFICSYPVSYKSEEKLVEWIIDAMQEYAAQFKAEKENSDPEVPVISEKMIRNSCDILACHYQLSIDDIKAAITNYVSGKQETNEQPKRVSDEEKTPEAIFKDFASFNKFLYDLTQYEMEVIIAMLYEQKAYASQHPIEQEKYGITDKIIEEAMNINTPFFGNSGAKFPIIEQEKVTDVAKAETDIGKIVDMPELNENELKHGIASILSVNKGYPIRELADRILAYVKYQIKQTEQEKPSESAEEILYAKSLKEMVGLALSYDECLSFVRGIYARQKHLPTDEEIGAKKNELFSQWNNPYTDDELNHNDNMERYRKGFDAAIEWLRDKLNNKEK